MQSKPSKSLFRRVLGGLLTALLSLALIVVFYLAVILGNPQATDEQPTMLTDQPLVSASPAMTITQGDQLKTLMDAFPAPVMYPISGSGLTLTGGESYDAAFESGFGRILKLHYQTADGSAVTLISIYPARALSLLPTEGYALSGQPGQLLAGMRSVRMEHTGGIRLHAQGYEALYAVEVPIMETGALLELTRSLHLYEGR